LPRGGSNAVRQSPSDHHFSGGVPTRGIETRDRIGACQN
jgi:hypothetical protein